MWIRRDSGHSCSFLRNPEVTLFSGRNLRSGKNLLTLGPGRHLEVQKVTELTVADFLPGEKRVKVTESDGFIPASMAESWPGFPEVLRARVVNTTTSRAGMTTLGRVTSGFPRERVLPGQSYPQFLGKRDQAAQRDSSSLGETRLPRVVLPAHG